MWLRLRQIALVAADLRRAAADIGNVLGIEACYTDPGVKIFGLKNTLWPIGTQFLEVVTPTGEGTAAGRYLDRRGGDGGYMVITQCDDIGRRRARAAELGIRVAFDLTQVHEGHDGIQLHPADTGGALLEMDQMLFDGGDTPGGPWYPAGDYWEPYVRTDVVSGISAAEIQSEDPESLSARWAAMTEIDAATDGNGHPIIELDNATLRFVEATDGRGEGLGGIDVVTEDREWILCAAEANGCLEDDVIVVAGLRINLA